MRRLVGLFLGCLLGVTSVHAASGADLSRFSALPVAAQLAGYPAESAAVIAQLTAYWEQGAAADAVYYGMHAPAEHDQSIVRWALARLPMLSTPYYFLLSRRQFAAAPDQAVVWHLVAGVNAFYDAGRCALEDTDEQIQHLFSINRQAIAWKEVIRQRGDLTSPLERAVDWLRANPGLPAPDYLCAGSLDTAQARDLRGQAVDKLENMVASDAVPVADATLKALVEDVMAARQDLLLTRLSLQNLEQTDAEPNALVIGWANTVDDPLLGEYLALAYLKYWDVEIAREALAYHASPLGQKMLQNAINERLGLGGQYIRLSDAEDAAFREIMSTPAMQRMQQVRKPLMTYQKYLLRMAAGDPRP